MPPHHREDVVDVKNGLICFSTESTPRTQKLKKLTTSALVGIPHSRSLFRLVARIEAATLGSVRRASL
jgi:hypothetical protein